MTAQPTPEAAGASIGPTVTVPYGDLTLEQATGYVADGDTFWVATMPPILAAYPGISNVSYWELTVAEHQALLAWAQRGGDDG